MCVPVCTRTAVILGRNSDWCSLDLPVCWAGILGKPGSEPLWGLVSLLQKELRVSTFQSSSESESRALVKVLSPSARLEGTEMGRHTAGGRVNPALCNVMWAWKEAGAQQQIPRERLGLTCQQASGSASWVLSGKVKGAGRSAAFLEKAFLGKRLGKRCSGWSAELGGDRKAVGAQSGWGFWGPRHMETPDLKHVSAAEGNTQVCPGLLSCLQEGGWDLGRGGVPHSEHAERTPALHSLGPFPALRSRL